MDELKQYAKNINELGLEIPIAKQFIIFNKKEYSLQSKSKNILITCICKYYKKNPWCNKISTQKIKSYTEPNKFCYICAECYNYLSIIKQNKIPNFVYDKQKCISLSINKENDPFFIKNVYDTFIQNNLFKKKDCKLNIKDTEYTIQYISFDTYNSFDIDTEDAWFNYSQEEYNQYFYEYLLYWTNALMTWNNQLICQHAYLVKWSQHLNKLQTNLKYSNKK